MPKKVRMWVPMKMEARIRIKPFSAINLASAVRPWPDSPRVNDRKIGVFPIGLTIGNSAPTIRSVFFTRSLSAPAIIAPSTVAPIISSADMNTLAGGGCYVNGNSVMVPPALGTYGTMGRNVFRKTGFKNVDFSVFKDFKLRDRFGVQFRFDIFNLFNHPN